MEQLVRTVAVIALWESDGTMRPLRLQLEGSGQRLRVDIQEVIAAKKLCTAGRESQVFDCFGKIGNLTCRIELKYCIQSHAWLLLRKDF
mgnify:CR=1 FL=1